jgi:hypothetical protein
MGNIFYERDEAIEVRIPLGSYVAYGSIKI